MKPRFMRVDRLPAMAHAVQMIGARRVLVGIPAADTERKEDDAVGFGEPITNAALLFIHENGAPEANIPARPTLKPGIDDAAEDIAGRLTRAAGRAMDGQDVDFGQTLEAVGLVAVNAVRRRINNNTPPPLAPATIAKRKRKGRNSTKTLVDTGAMRNAVTYVVRRPKGGGNA